MSLQPGRELDATGPTVATEFGQASLENKVREKVQEFKAPNGALGLELAVRGSMLYMA